MASQDVQAILAALQAAQQPGAPPTNPAQPPPLPQSGIPAPAYSGVVPTPPPQQAGYPSYALPQPAASGSIDLSAIKPVGHGNVNFQDALAKVQGFASARGIPPPSSGTSSAFPIAFTQPIHASQPTYAAASTTPRQDPRLAGRASARRSRSPPENYNPYRDERRDDPRRQNGYGRSRSRSPSRGQRDTFASTRDRDYGRDDPDSEVISIESNLVGLVIGRGGENLKRIEKDTGARIQFITGPQHNGPQRECRLSGSVRCRQDAKQMIWQILDENGGHASAMKASSGQPPSKTQAQSQSRQTANQPKLREGENSVQIMVPDKTVGLIIGRGGETIRDLQEKSQCHINIVGENKSVNGLRPVNLIGSAQAAQYARELILEIVDSDTRNQEPSAGGGRQQQDRRQQSTGAVAAGSDKITEMIRVPSDAVGMIIGKGGETIKQMQLDTGCKINVQQAQGQDIERPIELVGDYAAIGRAKAVIWDKVEQVKEKNGSGGNRSQGRSDQQFGAPQVQQQPYGQQPYGQQPAAAPGAPNADPYAQYGGYEAYTQMWAQYLQGQAAAGGATQQPQ